jgi:membrane protein DedA with SNARE-associated domain/membrane-associated phospholipid phosphatase
VEYFKAIIPAIEHFRVLGYWAVLLVSFLESLAFVGVVVPGAVFIVFAGSLAAKGYLDIGDLVWFASIGAILGDGISFRLGKGGHIRFREGNRIFKPALLETGKTFFERHGGKSVFLGRFVGLIRAVVPFVAGLNGMEAKRFYLWNVASAILWASAHLAAGYFLGQAWRAVETWSTRFGVVLGAVLLLVLGAWWLKKFLEKRGRELLALAGSLLASARGAIAANPRVRRLSEAHPAFLAFARKRFDWTEFPGLPLTLLGGLFLYTLLLLAGVIEDVLSLDPIVALDTRIGNLLHSFRDPALVKVFLWITLLGRTKIVLCVAAFLVLAFFLWGRRGFILPLLVTVAGSGAFNLLGKLALQRQRPPGIAAYEESSYSFPSGHSVMAVALYGFAAYSLCRSASTRGKRLDILFAGVFLVAAIGFSRLYLGVHYLSDVLGGYLLGTLWLIIGICMSEWSAYRKPSPGAPPFGAAAAKAATAGLLIACVAYYVHSGLRYSPAAYVPPPPTATVVSEADITGLPDRLLPKYTGNIVGDRQQPLSMVVFARSDRQLVVAFAKAGWSRADPLRIGTLLKWIGALASDAAYPSAPVSPSFWDGRVNDISFEKATAKGTSRQRHQVRLWKADLRTPDGNDVFVGTAVLDSGLKWGLVYRIGPDIDAERDAVRQDLLTAGSAASAVLRRFVPPMEGRNSFGDPFTTDGRIALIPLKRISGDMNEGRK